MKIIGRLITLLMFVVTAISWSQEVPVVHDPVVIEENGTYHLFCTGKGISHFTSADLQNWKMVQPVFEEKPSWTDNVVPNFEKSEVEMVYVVLPAL